jgi:hypothetical protein
MEIKNREKVRKLRKICANKAKIRKLRKKTNYGKIAN